MSALRPVVRSFVRGMRGTHHGFFLGPLPAASATTLRRRILASVHEAASSATRRGSEIRIVVLHVARPVPELRAGFVAGVNMSAATERLRAPVFHSTAFLRMARDPGSKILFAGGWAFERDLLDRLCLRVASAVAPKDHEQLGSVVVSAYQLDSPD